MNIAFSMCVQWGALLGVSNFPSLLLVDARITVKIGKTMSGSCGGSCVAVTVGQAVKCKERNCDTDATFVEKVPESWLSSVVSQETNPHAVGPCQKILPDVIPSVP